MDYYGILRSRLYKVEQGIAYDYLSGMDPASYERIVFKVLDAEQDIVVLVTFPRT